MGVVWHGHYIKYFEDGREAFGAKYGVTYLDMFDSGFMTPIVKTSCEHKIPLHYGQKCTVETTYMDCAAAKIIFDFQLYGEHDKALVATGQSTQVFLDRDGQMKLTIPDFFMEWKRKMGVTDF